jgi:hypothetical protein
LQDGGYTDAQLAAARTEVGELKRLLDDVADTEHPEAAADDVEGVVYDMEDHATMGDE